MNNQILPRPFIKWVGGKKQLLPQIRNFLPKREEINDYYEPFLGGGAVFFELRNRNKNYLNDINKTLINTYRSIKNNPNRVIQELKKIQEQYLKMQIEDRRKFYYKIRDRYNNLSNKLFEKSIYFIFLNKTCFNGMYRENSRGEFNIPFGSHKKPLIVDRKNILLVSNLLKNSTITSNSFKDAVRHTKNNDFIYFDPPYDPINKTSSFTSYSKSDFSTKDQLELKNTVDELNNKGCFVMLSNSQTPFIRELYRNYRHEEVYASRAINSKGIGRGKVKELLILNY